MASKHHTGKKSYEEYLRNAHPPKRRKKASAKQYRRLLGFALLIAVISMIVLLVQGDELLLKEIKVTGSFSQNSSEIISVSGLRLGMNILNVDQEEIRRNFSSNSSVELKDIRIEMPDTVILEVRERSVCAAVSCVGVMLMVDRDGYVLQRAAAVPQNMGIPVVSGMDARLSPNGKTVESGTEGQVEVMINVLSAIYDAQMQTIVSEANIEDMNNIYLMSVSGIQVMIGDDEDLPVKLAWMRAVIDQMTAEGVMSGIVDVSSGVNAVYSEK